MEQWFPNSGTCRGAIWVTYWVNSNTQTPHGAGEVALKLNKTETKINNRTVQIFTVSKSVGWMI